MNREHNITFHIGFHKTATTTLQRQVFPACKDLNFLAGIADIDRFVHAVCTQDPIYFDADFHRKRASAYFSMDKPTLVSKEALSGAPLAGLGKRNLDHRSAILQNLHAAVPEARIILVLRRQNDLAISMYRQYLKNSGSEAIGDFYGLSDNSQPIVSADRFRFQAYVEKTMSMFSAGALILTFEEFVYRRRVFLNRLGEFLGITIPDIVITSMNATRFGSMGLETSRILNRFFRNRLNPTGPLPKLMPAVHYRWPIKGNIKPQSRIRAAADEILNRVRDDNRQLDQQYHLGLADYGYY